MSNLWTSREAALGGKGFTPAEEKAILRRMDIRILPAFSLLYLFSFLGASSSLLSLHDADHPFLLCSQTVPLLVSTLSNSHPIIDAQTNAHTQQATHPSQDSKQTSNSPTCNTLSPSSLFSSFMVFWRSRRTLHLSSLVRGLGFRLLCSRGGLL